MALVGGKEVEIRLIPGTVQENLDFNKIEYDSDDEVSPALGEKVDSEDQIVLDYVEYSIVEKNEEVKSESTVELDPELESGVKKKTKGNDGEGVFIYKTKTVNGVESGTERELKEWITEPHNTVLHLGTKRTGHEGKYEIKGTFTANCSAYWMGNNCYGAGGGKCVYGTVAVDRFKYPYGTKFWIEGYGYAVANDCGTSIKGDKLDLWMDSYAESCRWGRRHMTPYILEEAK